METIDLDSWNAFEKYLASFFSQWKKLKREKRPMTVSTPVFRGQSDASWNLETTLERFTNRKFSTFDYYSAIRSVKPAVVSMTEKEWQLPKFEKFKADKVLLVPIGLEFMVYLRHHGFPSPLLDWTRSPYVSAFFAFRSPQLSSNGRVAIYSYIDWCGVPKGSWGGSPVVHCLGPYVETHKRHYAQQCEYTVCTKEVGDEHVYCSHESAFTDNRSEQGALKKLTLPVSERRNALKQLHRMNVTAFSLFGSEESLMETLAYQEIEDSSETE